MQQCKYTMDEHTKTILSLIHEKYGLDFDELVENVSSALCSPPQIMKVKRNKERTTCANKPKSSKIALEFITIDDHPYFYNEQSKHVYTYDTQRPQLVGKYSYELGAIIPDV